MKKLLLVLLWIILCVSIIVIPKIAEKLTPKIEIKEIYRVKIIEKEVFKEVMIPFENNVFKITKISDKPHEAYKVEFINNFDGGCMIWGGYSEKRDFYLSVEYEKGANHQHPIPELREIAESQKKEELKKLKEIYYVPNARTGQIQMYQNESCVSAPTVYFSPHTIVNE